MSKTPLQHAKRYAGCFLDTLRPYRQRFAPAFRAMQRAGRAGPGLGARAVGRHVLMLVVSDLRVDPRVEREARALAAAGYTVHVLCPDPTYGASPGPVIDWGSGVGITFLPWQTGRFIGDRPGYFGDQLFAAAIDYGQAHPLLAIHAHDLNTCWAGLAAARTLGVHLVADFHEWTSENVHWDKKTQSNQPYPPYWKRELQRLEAQLMVEASAVITVSESIVEALAAELGQGRKATLVRNIPQLSAQPTREYPPLKSQLGLRNDQFLLLWQGGTGPTRLIEPIIKALALAPDCHLVIRGPSLEMFGPGYEAIAAQAGAGHRLFLQAPVPSADVVAAACSADAGIWTLPNLCRNFSFALPNKIFEYTAAGLALLVADYPEARRIVQSHEIGLVFDPYDPASIAGAINALIRDPEQTARFRHNTQAALDRIGGEREWNKIVDIYDGLPRAASASAVP